MSFARSPEKKPIEFAADVKKFWDSDVLLDSVFNEVIVLFFQTDESLATLARWGMAKIFTIAVYSLLKDMKTTRTILIPLSLA